MLLIDCPWCGPRPESDFSYGGEAHIARPTQPDRRSDQEWGDYLFMRKNPKGSHREQWCHSAGCRRWFNVERDTVSYRITAVYKVGETPDVAGAAAPRVGQPERSASDPPASLPGTPHEGHS